MEAQRRRFLEALPMAAKSEGALVVEVSYDEAERRARQYSGRSVGGDLSEIGKEFCDHVAGGQGGEDVFVNMKVVGYYTSLRQVFRNMHRRCARRGSLSPGRRSKSSLTLDLVLP